MVAELLLTAGDGAGRRWALAEGRRLLLGRGDDVAIRLRDPDASRHHAAVEATPGGVRVTDLGSKNGTFLAGQRLPAQQARLMARGDQLRIGAHVLVLELRDDAPRGPSLVERYEVGAILGQGGNATVRAARSRATGEPVAIKMLHTEMFDPVQRERFLRESAIRVAHPNVVALLEAGFEGQHAYLVLELMPGGTAADVLARGPLPLRVAPVVRLGEQAARGLAALHAAGVVHRDVKPANILLARDGTAKIGDLGMAKQGGASGSLTATGQGLGTLSYVAPEQAHDAKRATPAADLYGLGATLYHLLGGRPPVEADTIEAWMAHLDDEPARLETLRPALPPPLVELVHALLQRDPDDRPPSARIVADELRDLASGLTGA
jgi:serine/threonine protein kinase